MSDVVTDLREKVDSGGRLSKAEALALVRQASVHELGAMGLANRTRRHGRKAYYVYNQHLNYTNICANQCRFCAYSKQRGEKGGFTYSAAQARDRLEKRKNAPVREVHIVGGLNPALPYRYYIELLRTVKQTRPEARVKAFTAVEIAFLADSYGKSETEVLEELIEAGLDALPGGGAEVFDPDLRHKLCPEKVSGQRWLGIHQTAHSLGLHTNATLLFGHIEGWEERLDHLEALRDLQDETGGFLCFIPLPYQPKNNRLGGVGPDGQEYLRMIALSRLFLDNVPHLKAYWVMAGIKPAQLALWAGADDFDGTLVEERIGHAAGAEAPTGMTVGELEQAIAAAGFAAVQRDTFFRPLGPVL